MTLTNGIVIKRPAAFPHWSKPRRALLRIVPALMLLIVLFAEAKPAKASIWWLAGTDVVCQCNSEAGLLWGGILAYIFG
jgi:hypothetical protein